MQCSTLGWSFCTIPQFHISSTSRIRRLPSVSSCQSSTGLGQACDLPKSILGSHRQTDCRGRLLRCDTQSASALASASNWLSRRNSHGPLLLTAQPDHFCGLIKVYRSAGLVICPMVAASATAAACWSNSLHLAHCTPAAQQAHQQPRGQRPSQFVRNTELGPHAQPPIQPWKSPQNPSGASSGLTHRV